MKTYLGSCKTTVKLVTKCVTAEMLLIANFLQHKAIKYQKEKHYCSHPYLRDENKCEIQAALTHSGDKRFAHILLLSSHQFI